MGLRKPGSRQRSILEDLLNGAKLDYDPIFAEYGPGPIMTHGSITVVVDRRVVASLHSGGYIERVKDTAGRGGWFVTQAGKRAMER